MASDMPGDSCRSCPRSDGADGATDDRRSSYSLISGLCSSGDRGQDGGGERGLEPLRQLCAGDVAARLLLAHPSSRGREKGAATGDAGERCLEDGRERPQAHPRSRSLSRSRSRSRSREGDQRRRPLSRSRSRSLSRSRSRSPHRTGRTGETTSPSSSSPGDLSGEAGGDRAAIVLGPGPGTGRSSRLRRGEIGRERGGGERRASGYRAGSSRYRSSRRNLSSRWSRRRPSRPSRPSRRSSSRARYDAHSRSLSRSRNEGEGERREPLRKEGARPRAGHARCSGQKERSQSRAGTASMSRAPRAGTASMSLARALPSGSPPAGLRGRCGGGWRPGGVMPAGREGWRAGKRGGWM